MATGRRRKKKNKGGKKNPTGRLFVPGEKDKKKREKIERAEHTHWIDFGVSSSFLTFWRLHARIAARRGHGSVRTSAKKHDHFFFPTRELMSGDVLCLFQIFLTNSFARLFFKDFGGKEKKKGEKGEKEEKMEKYPNKKKRRNI